MPSKYVPLGHVIGIRGIGDGDGEPVIPVGAAVDTGANPPPGNGDAHGDVDGNIELPALATAVVYADATGVVSGDRDAAIGLPDAAGVANALAPAVGDTPGVSSGVGATVDTGGRVMSGVGTAVAELVAPLPVVLTGGGDARGVMSGVGTAVAELVAPPPTVVFIGNGDAVVVEIGVGTAVAELVAPPPTVVFIGNGDAVVVEIGVGTALAEPATVELAGSGDALVVAIGVGIALPEPVAFTAGGDTVALGDLAGTIDCVAVVDADPFAVPFNGGEDTLGVMGGVGTAVAEVVPVAVVVFGNGDAVLVVTGVATLLADAVKFDGAMGEVDGSGDDERDVEFADGT